MFRIDGVYYCWRGYYCVRYGRVSCHKALLAQKTTLQYHTENDSLFNYLYQINQFHLVQSNKASCKATEYSSDTLIQPKVRKKIGALASGGDSNFTRSRCLLIFEGHESEGVPLL
ncbi:unnamed protein product [Rhizophagus irregularis]|nr:unnamed protein product [Rhizophagus irregularis]